MEEAPDVFIPAMPNRAHAIDEDFRELILSLLVRKGGAYELTPGAERIIDDALWFQDFRARAAVEQLLGARGVSL